MITLAHVFIFVTSFSIFINKKTNTNTRTKLIQSGFISVLVDLFQGINKSNWWIESKLAKFVELGLGQV